MTDISGLWSLQVMMFLLVVAGMILKKKGILRAEAQSALTDAVIYFFLPCNIITSFMLDFETEMLGNLLIVLIVSVFIQAFSYILSRVLYRGRPDEIRQVMRYCTMVSNSGFLGLPLAQGIFGAEGMMYASVYIIPMRIVMWSAGISCFTDSPDFGSVVRKVALHPCVIAIYIGLFYLLTQHRLDACYQLILAGAPAPAAALTKVVVTAVGKTVTAGGNCVTGLTMVLIGMMVADTHPRDMLDRDAGFISALRLVILPGIVLIACHFIGLSPFISGVCVLMSGMPAGSTSAILAAKYGCNYTFAARCIVVSTLISMVTIPLWCMAV